MSNNFSISSEASTLELLGRNEEMFPLYYIDSDVIRGFKYIQPDTGLLPIAKV